MLEPPAGIRGVWRIVQFNWPLYVAGAAVAAISTLVAVSDLRGPFGAKALTFGAAAASFYWMTASLVASWIVYDRSGLVDGDWIRQMLQFTPRSWIAIHAGFDEITPALCRIYAGSAGRSLDIYDPARMPEGSIARARRHAAHLRAERTDCACLPLRSGSVDAVVLALSAHELRTHAARCTLFHEVRRVLAPGGRVVVAEHLRGLANFAAFGPGVLHFHSRNSWARCFGEAGLLIERETAITPFVRAFVLAVDDSSSGVDSAGGPHAFR